MDFAHCFGLSVDMLLMSVISIGIVCVGANYYVVKHSYVKEFAGLFDFMCQGIVLR